MSATVKLSERASIVLDVIRPTENTSRGVLLTLQGSTADPLSCAVIPLASVRAVIASLELAAEEAGRA